MNGRKQHYHHPLTPTQDVLGFGTRGVRFFADGDGDEGNGGQGGSTGGDGKQVTMSQAAFDAIVRDAKAQAKRSAKADLEAKYGDLDALKAKAESTDGADAKEALDTILKALNVDAGNGDKPQDLVAKATERVQTLVTAEQAQAEAVILKVRQDALTKAGLKPELAPILALKGTTPDELEAEIAALKPVVGAMGQQGAGNQGTGTGTGNVGTGGNPANAGNGTPATLSEAIGSHYGQ